MFDIGSYFPPAIKTICIACVSVFLLQELSALLFGEAGVRFWTFGLGLVPYAAVFGFRIWQPFTYIFLHGGILHILFNLLYLAMFGADLERAWGRRRYCGYHREAAAGPARPRYRAGAYDRSFGCDLRRAAGCGDDNAAPAGVGIFAGCDGVHARVCDCDGRD